MASQSVSQWPAICTLSLTKTNEALVIKADASDARMTIIVDTFMQFMNLLSKLRFLIFLLSLFLRCHPLLLLLVVYKTLGPLGAKHYCCWWWW